MQSDGSWWMMGQGMGNGREEWKIVVGASTQRWIVWRDRRWLKTTETYIIDNMITRGGGLR